MRSVGISVLTVAMLVGCSDNTTPKWAPYLDRVVAQARSEAVRIEWTSIDDPPGEHRYRIFRGATAQVSPEQHDDVRDTPLGGVVWTGLAAGVETYFVIQVELANGSLSPLSPVVSAVPSAAGAVPGAEILLTNTGPALDTDYGERLSSAGDLDGDGDEEMVVGAPLFDLTPPSSDEGRASVYFGSHDLLTTAPRTWERNGDLSGHELGNGVAEAGDLNADGYDDLLIAAPGFGAGGRAELYIGDEVNNPVSVWRYEPASPISFLAGVAAGDVDGDGWGDIVLSAPFTGGNNTGWVGVFLGPGNGDLPRTDQPDWSATHPGTNALLGAAIALGDFNSDAAADIAVAVPGANEVIVFHGASPVTAIDPSGSWSTTLVGSSNPMELAVGNFNGDSYDDLAVARDSSGPAEHGSVAVFMGGMNGLFVDPGFTATGVAPGDHFGSGLAAGDVNDDGYSDLIIGARDETTGAGTGWVGVYLGSPAGLSASTSLDLYAAVNFEQFGRTVETVDIDGDGADEFFVSTHQNTGGPDQVLLYAGAVTRGPGADVFVTTAGTGVVGISVGEFLQSNSGLYTCEVDWGDGGARVEINDCSKDALESQVHDFGARRRSADVTVIVRNAHGVATSTVSRINP